MCNQCGVALNRGPRKELAGLPFMHPCWVNHQRAIYVAMHPAHENLVAQAAAARAAEQAAAAQAAVDAQAAAADAPNTPQLG